jgi:hypothetical protein
MYESDCRQHSKKLHSPGTRVTRLGEFSPIGWLFTFGTFVKITEVAQIIGLLFFHTKSYVLIFTKNELRHIYKTHQGNSRVVSITEWQVRTLRLSTVSTRVARWYIFKPKNPDLGKFGRVLYWKMLVYYVGIVHLAYYESICFAAIWYGLRYFGAYFPLFGMLY